MTPPNTGSRGRAKSLRPRRDGILYRNLIGRQIQKLRYQRNWSQDRLTQELQFLGWNITRSKLAKIELGFIWIAEWEILFFSRALKVSSDALLPQIKSEHTMFEDLQRLLRTRHPG